MTESEMKTIRQTNGVHLFAIRCQLLQIFNFSFYIGASPLRCERQNVEQLVFLIEKQKIFLTFSAVLRASLVRGLLFLPKFFISSFSPSFFILHLIR